MIQARSPVGGVEQRGWASIPIEMKNRQLPPSLSRRKPGPMAPLAGTYQLVAVLYQRSQAPAAGSDGPPGKMSGSRQLRNVEELVDARGFRRERGRSMGVEDRLIDRDLVANGGYFRRGGVVRIGC